MLNDGFVVMHVGDVVGLGFVVLNDGFILLDDGLTTLDDDNIGGSSCRGPSGCSPTAATASVTMMKRHIILLLLCTCLL